MVITFEMLLLVISIMMMVDCVDVAGGFHDVNALQVDHMEDMYFNGTGYIYLDNFNT